jgi:hypothetical protein
MAASDESTVVGRSPAEGGGLLAMWLFFLFIPTFTLVLILQAEGVGLPRGDEAINTTVWIPDGATTSVVERAPLISAVETLFPDTDVQEVPLGIFKQQVQETPEVYIVTGETSADLVYVQPALDDSGQEAATIAQEAALSSGDLLRSLRSVELDEETAVLKATVVQDWGITLALGLFLAFFLSIAAIVAIILAWPVTKPEVATNGA